MIPGKLLTFLNERSSVGVSGTRDRQVTPHVQFVSGWSVEADQQTMRCSFHEAYRDGLIDSLEDNGQFALTVEQIGSHETYQFKGDYVGSESAGDEDLAVHERIKSRFVEIVCQLYGFPKEVVLAYVARPSLVIRFKVREIFLQTPGPGAGQRLSPPEAS